jgi:hypothetical protein
MLCPHARCRARNQWRYQVSGSKVSALLKIMASCEACGAEVPTDKRLTDEGRVALVLAALRMFAVRFLDAPDAEGRARLQEVLRVLGEP